MSMLLQCVVAQPGWVYTMRHLGLLADSLIIGQPAQMHSLIFLFSWPILLPPGDLLCLSLWHLFVSITLLFVNFACTPV